MAKKSEKNSRKNSTVNTTEQTGRSSETKAQNCKTEHPDKPDARNYR